jgi:pimeloyl-ACP methyl ester carboxylesterase
MLSHPSRFNFRLYIVCALVVAVHGTSAFAIQDDSDQADLPTRTKYQVASSIDNSKQPIYLTVPQGIVAKNAESARNQDTLPMVVSLHSWSADLEQRQPELEKAVAAKKWICLQPNFRGINNHPEALASTLAQQDVLDAVDWVVANFPVDAKRIYLTGNSGGGHMTMLMASLHPQRWRAASAWVGIHDLFLWHELHKDSKYGAMMRKCCNGAPGDSKEVDEQYRLRSPKTHLHAAKDVALDIAAGIQDGHEGSVPIHHSLDAFNIIARANGDQVITEEEIAQLSQKDGRLTKPNSTDVGHDSSFDRQFYLRRTSKNCRVTIFEGGHEGIASAAMAWFESH